MADRDYNYVVFGQTLAPFTAAKETLDDIRLVYDLSCWLDPGEVVASVDRATAIVLQTSVSPQNWRQDYPVIDVFDTSAAPDDAFPLVIVSTEIVDPNSSFVEVWVTAGTPGLSYVLSFLVMSSVSQRRKQVDTIITIELPLNTAMEGAQMPAAPGAYVNGGGASFTPVSGISSNVASIDLGAGDWVVDGSVNFSTGESLIYQLSAGANLVSNNLPATPYFTRVSPGGGLAGGIWCVTIPEQRFYLTGPATVYLVVNCTFGPGSTFSAVGHISARNVLGVDVPSTLEGPIVIGSMLPPADAPDGALFVEDLLTLELTTRPTATTGPGGHMAVNAHWNAAGQWVYDQNGPAFLINHDASHGYSMAIAASGSAGQPIGNLAGIEALQVVDPTTITSNQTNFYLVTNEAGVVTLQQVQVGPSGSGPGGVGRVLYVPV